jgi:hypothetical protein
MQEECGSWEKSDFLHGQRGGKKAETQTGAREERRHTMAKCLENV